MIIYVSVAIVAVVVVIKTVIKLLEILVINYYCIFNGLRSMPARPGVS